MCLQAGESDLSILAPRRHHELMAERISNLDDWSPPTPHEMAHLLEELDAQWWIAGGFAVDLFVGRKTREHRDIDIAALSIDKAQFHAHLASWEPMVHVGWVGEPEKSDAWFDHWNGDPSDDPVHQVWFRPGGGKPWSFEILFSPGTHQEWRFKKDQSLRLPTTALGVIRDGLPVLRPEIVLLHKANSSYEGEFADKDFDVLLPLLEADRRAWLAAAISSLNPDQRWLGRLRDDL